MAVKYKEGEVYKDPKTGEWMEYREGYGPVMFSSGGEEAYAKQQAQKGVFAKEQGYVDQAVGAGQKLGQEYLTGQERLGQSMQEQGTAMQRMAARSLMGATPFGAPGGAAVMPAAATALQAQERVAGMERTGIGQMTDLGALGQQATQAGAEYGLSAMAGPRQQQKKLGYMQYYFDARKSLSKADADALLANLLMNETDPTVVTEMQSFIQTSE
jgi:hypothetical protein